MHSFAVVALVVVSLAAYHHILQSQLKTYLANGYSPQNSKDDESTSSEAQAHSSSSSPEIKAIQRPLVPKEQLERLVDPNSQGPQGADKFDISYSAFQT